MYENLDTKEAKKNIFRITQIQKRVSKNLYIVRCIKDVLNMRIKKF